MEKSLLLSEKEVYEYLKDLFIDLKDENISCKLDVYHHNTSYENIESVILNGIHPLVEQKKLGIKDFSLEELKRLDDVTSHVNGNDGISLSKTNLDDLYPDEDVYNPYSERLVDILIDSIKAHRSTMHYGNEFIHDGSILQDKFLMFDVRIISLIEKSKNKEDLELLKNVIKKVNYLKTYAALIHQKGLDIPIREMSLEESHEKGISLNKDKLMVMPKIIVKN